MSAMALDLRRTAGFIVADKRGRVVGKVEGPMYGTTPDVPDALSVRGWVRSEMSVRPGDVARFIIGEAI